MIPQDIVNVKQSEEIFMDSNLIVIKQLPVIEEHLQKMKLEIEQRVGIANALECSEDTRNEVKKVRTQLNKDLEDFENRRKEVKKKIEEPYKQFEQIYKENISEPFKAGISKLDEKIRTVESGIKSEKERKVKAYFDEYQKSMGIDFLSLEKSGIQITLSASEKSLKTAAKEYIDKVSDDLKLIETQEYSNEILIEYKKNLSVSAAITTVLNRHRELDEIAAAKAEQEKTSAQLKAAEDTVDEIMTEIAPPTVETEQKEAIFELTFTVRATKNKLRDLKEFLTDGGYEIL